MIIKDRRDILESKCAWILAEAIQQVALSKSRVLLAVPGGRSIVAVLKKLRNESVDWEKVHLFMVDERIVPPGHEDSNFRLAASCLEGIITTTHLHPFPYIPGNTNQAVHQYEDQLISFGGRFDVTLLASGEDGHVAGLFPGHETIKNEEEFFVLTDNAPKPPPIRVSATKKLIANSQTALLLFFGKDKHEAFSAYLDGDKSLCQCPAKIVDSIANNYVLTDCTHSFERG